MNILMVCTGNTCRSPMAQHLMQRALGQLGVAASVQSAGLAADGSPISQGALQALQQRGIDASGHLSQQVTPEMCAAADVIFTMSQGHKQALVQFFGVPQHKIQVLGSGIPDPFGGDAALYEAACEAIDRAVQQAAEGLAKG